MMNRLSVLLCLLPLTADASSRPRLKTVDKVDIERFMGSWYVIAAIPTSIEKEAYNAVETYRLNPKGTIDTVFTFNKGAFDGPPKRYTPRGFIRDRVNNSTWGMRFIWPFKSEFLITYLDQSYSQTIISRNKRDFAWIMARTPEIPEADYEKLRLELTAQGYDLAKLRKVPHRWAGNPQPAGVPEAGQAPASSGGVQFSVEGGAAWQTRNDFRIPGDRGTLVKLADYDRGPASPLRMTLSWDLGAHQSLRLLAAPLRVETTFTPSQPVAFQELVFPAGRLVDSTYVFNSYRLTWYRRFARGDKWAFRLGGTLKVRDAETGLSGTPGSSVKKNVGGVPLLYGFARYRASERLSLEAEFDALAAPQGRAEDVSVKAVLRLADKVDADIGYRLLEGGADNDSVYTFAFFHYAVAGIRIRF
jgi:apolipoprotein D and lipocalin family protein